MPRLGRYTPARILAKVDLPAPFSPSSAWISPRHQVEVDVAQHLDGGELLGNAAGADEDGPGGARPSLTRPSGTGEAGSISPCALRSAQKAAGIGRSRAAALCAHLARPGGARDHRNDDRVGEHELQRGGRQADAVRRHTASMPRTLAWISGGALA